MLKRLLPYAAIFFLIETVTRVTLFVREKMEVGISLADTVMVFALGLWFDLITLGFFLLPPALLFLFASPEKQSRTWFKRNELGLRFVFAYVLVFSALSEHIFWSEFSTRFNFIAVDYLIYTQEVIGNIMESYPVGWLLLALAFLAAAIVWASGRPLKNLPPAESFKPKFNAFLLILSGTLGGYAITRQDMAQFSENTEANELASNGIYSLFYAFWNNEINYERFYATLPDEEVSAHIQQLIAGKQNSTKNGSLHDVDSQSPTRHKNVMIVVMESMSAEYMGAFGNTNNLTPNLDRLAKEGLFFTQAYATGTRTVRGLEAISLSIPPTPGQSIIRRDGNDHLFSLASVLDDRGYESKFIYGGHGYFDNMNAYFAANGFTDVDRGSMSKDEIHFANIWGVADDDLFARAIKEGTKSYKAGKPFLQMIMTTSNHRPYTYPEGRIDIPSKSGRFGGVKYSDYSIGKLMEWVQKEPWYKDTIFVFAADHTAGVAGKVELDPRKYHIPIIFYAPGFLPQKRYEKLVSQIDIAPTVLGLLGIDYHSKFFGRDVLGDETYKPRAFISNYQKVALVEDDVMTVLAPKKEIKQWRFSNLTLLDKPDEQAIQDAIAYYQVASHWRTGYKTVSNVKEKK